MNLLYLSAPGGGLDTNVRVLAPALVRAGHRVSILYIHFPGETIPNAADGIEGCRVYHAAVGDWHYYARRATFGRSSLPLVVRAFEHARTLGRMVTDIYQREGLDLVELPEVITTPKWMNDIPYVMRLHSSAWMCRQMYGEASLLSDSIEARLEGYTLRRAIGISSPSEFVADYIRPMCNLGKQPIEIIPYPIDTAQFAPNTERAKPPLILFVGRVEKRKGADVLMRAIPLVRAKHPDCKFAFAGRVSDDLQEQVATMPACVQFLGVQPREELVQWYQRASVFVAPSLWDNSPNTVYEAMACGAPVVASRVGGIPELVDDGTTGLLVPPDDAKALADAILALLDDPARRAQMGQRAREKAVVEYGVEKVAARTLEFYGRVLAG
jgi:glycosyltransferase involved in cell wall biosynthesis